MKLNLEPAQAHQDQKVAKVALFGTFSAMVWEACLEAISGAQANPNQYVAKVALFGTCSARPLCVPNRAGGQASPQGDSCGTRACCDALWSISSLCFRFQIRRGFHHRPDERTYRVMSNCPNNSHLRVTCLCIHALPCIHSLCLAAQ